MMKFYKFHISSTLGVKSGLRQPRLAFGRGRGRARGEKGGNAVGLLFRVTLLMTVSLAASLPAARAIEPGSASEEEGRVKLLMHTFVLEFAKMSPYIASDEAFSSEKGKATVRESLKTLAGKLKNPPPEKIEKTAGFRITYGMLADHIQKTQAAFDAGEMANARMRVNGIGNLCAACHMQAPKISHFSAFEFVVGRSRDVNFDNAEFLFVIRRYDEALAQFDKLVREYPKSAITSSQLSEAYRRKLAIFARVFRDPAMAVANLNTDLKNTNLPVDSRRNIESWIESLQKWKEEKNDPSKLKTSDLIAYVAKNIPSDVGRKIAPEHPQLLNLLRLSGLLYERLYSEAAAEREKEKGKGSAKEKADDHTQEILYYLAQCERSLAPLYWYSVNEIYLKSCIVDYPKKAFSKKCYEAYKDGMKERYYGKTVPESVQESIDALKDYL